MAVALRTESASAKPWRHALPPLLALLGVAGIAYRDTFESMLAIWSRSGTFAHAFLVPPIVLLLIWRKRHELAALQPRPSPWTLAPMAAAAFVWLLGDLASVNSITQLAATSVLLLSVPLVLGVPVARVILFPLVFLFFAVPIGDFLLPQLIDWTADFTVSALRASGIPVFREGPRFVIPSGSWSVVEACSGARYLIASLMVGTLFAYLHFQTIWRRWAFAVFSLAVPVVANWVRAYLIVLLGHLSNNTLAVGVDHLIYGWLFFGLVIGVMYFVGMRWSEIDHANAAPPAPAAPGGSADRAGGDRSDGFWAGVCGAIIVAVAPHLALQALGEIALADVELACPDRLGEGWRANPGAAGDWQPAFQHPSAQTNFSGVDREARRVHVYLGYYRQQNFERKLVSSENVLVGLKDATWRMVGAAHDATIDIEGRALAVRSALLTSDAAPGRPERRLRAWQLYWVGGALTSSDLWAKLLAVTDRLRGRGDDAAVIIFYSVEDEPGASQGLLESFARANLDLVVAQLQKTREAARVNAEARKIEMSSGNATGISAGLVMAGSAATAAPGAGQRSRRW